MRLGNISAKHHQLSVGHVLGVYFFPVATVGCKGPLDLFLASLVINGMFAKWIVGVGRWRVALVQNVCDSITLGEAIL